MRVLVTGAHGCIGAWIVKNLLDRGVEVIAYDLHDQPDRLRMIAEPERVSLAVLMTGRIEDGEALGALVRNEEVTHIIHLAARLIPVCQADPVGGAMTNVIGTLNVFEAARNAGRPVRVVYASSAAVWGTPDDYGGQELSEDDPLVPTTHYGVYKRANEQSARVYWLANGISSVGLRPWTVYGVGRDAGLTADPTLAIRSVAEGRPFHVRVTGYMNFQYVEDVAAAFVECALGEFPGASVFNLAGEVATVEKFVEILSEIQPRSRELLTIGGNSVPVAFRISDARLRSALPQLPKTPLVQGIERTYRAFVRHTTTSV